MARRKPKNTARSSHIYQAFRLEVIARTPRCPECHCPHCSICGEPIQLWRPYRNPLTGRVDPMSVTLEHPTALARGGHLLDPASTLAHQKCNSSAGARLSTGPTPKDLQQPSRHF